MSVEEDDIFADGGQPAPTYIELDEFDCTAYDGEDVVTVWDKGKLFTIAVRDIDSMKTIREKRAAASDKRKRKTRSGRSKVYFFFPYASRSFSQEENRTRKKKAARMRMMRMWVVSSRLCGAMKQCWKCSRSKRLE